MSKVYVPVKCANKECAYPHITCNNCRCNQTEIGKSAFAFKNPHNMYKMFKDITKINSI